jgi:hypothetical protein
MTSFDIENEKKQEGLALDELEHATAVGPPVPSNFPIEKSKAEKKLVRKLDLLIPLMLGGAYFFAYLVSNASTDTAMQHSA